MNKLIQFLLAENGATATEYAVMMALIIIVCIGAVTLVGGETANFWAFNRQMLDGAYGP